LATSRRRTQPLAAASGSEQGAEQALDLAEAAARRRISEGNERARAKAKEDVAKRNERAHKEAVGQLARREQLRQDLRKGLEF
jgi:hypothetical protein